MSDENKEQIVNKALALFAAKGYEGVGVQEICEAAGITKPTLYYYFRSKRGLLEYIVDTHGQQLFETIKDALVYEHDFIKSLTKVLQAEIEFAVSNPDYFNFHAILLNSPAGSEQKEVYSVLVEKILNTYFEFFTSSCEEFGNMRGKEKLYGILFHNKVVSVASLCIRGEIVPDDQTIFQIIHSTVYGLAN